MVKKSKGSRWKASTNRPNAYRRPDKTEVYKLTPNQDYSNSKRLNEEYEQYKAQRSSQITETPKKKRGKIKVKAKKSSPYRSAPDERQVRSKPAPVKKKKRKKRKNVLLSYTIIAVVLVAALSVAMFVFFKVGEIKVTGSEKYTAAEIINASGIELGDNLFACSSGRAQKLILTQKPYVKSVTFKHELPDVLIINVTQADPAYAFENKGKYIICDDNLKVLEIAPSVPEKTALVSGAQIEMKAVGKPAKFKTEQSGETVKEIHSELYKAGLKNITAIDVSGAVNLKATYDGRIDILFGQISDLSYKAQLAKKAIEDLNKDSKTVKGTINVKQAQETKQAYFQPKN